MPNTLAIIQARMGSSRLPGKVLMDVQGEPMLSHIVERTEKISNLHKVIVATSTEPGDDSIEELCKKKGWICYRGKQDDVLDRYYQAAKKYGADHVVRVTADCPLLSPEETSKLISAHLADKTDYSHNVTIWGSGMPLGTGSEIFTFQALEKSWKEGLESHHREHVNEYINDNPQLFKIGRVAAPKELDRPNYRLTVDTIEDLTLIRKIYEALYQPGNIVDLRKAILLLDNNPELRLINEHIQQKPI